MSWLDDVFGGGDKINVATSVSRAIPDATLPNSIKYGALTAIFSHGDITDYQLDSLVSGIATRTEQMYTYAERDYAYGMPSGKTFAGNQGRQEVATLLQQQSGSPVLLEYCHFGAANVLHVGWLKLLALQGYDLTTNTLLALTAAKGVPVYLADMQVIIPEAQFLSSNTALVHWDVSAASGYTPAQKYTTPEALALKLPAPLVVSKTATEISITVTYVWEDKEKLLTGYLDIPLTTEYNQKDYFQAKYLLNGQVHYWMYEAGSGGYPVLDAVYAAPVTATGTFFPFTHFRNNQTRMNVAKDSAGFKTSQQMLKYLGMDFDSLADSINDNPQAGSLEQAMLFMAVPANTTNAIEQRYLFDFFDNQYYEDTDTTAMNVLVIQDKLFKLILRNHGISKKLGISSGQKIGSYTSGTLTTYTEEPYNVMMGRDASPITYTRSVPHLNHYYRKQITENVYEELRVLKLYSAYHIFDSYTAIGEAASPILLIPLDHSITKKYNLVDREQLYARSMHYVFNSLQKTHVSWYETPVFAAIIMVVAIVLTIIDMGTDGGTWVSLAAQLGVQLTLTQVYILMAMLSIANAMLVSALVSLFIDAVGIKVAFVAAIVAAVYGVSKGIEAGSLSKAPWAKELLEVSSNLTKGIGTAIQSDMQELLEDYSAFNVEAQTKQDELDAANKLLQSSNVLLPIFIAGETPKEFFSRTVESGNIGIVGIDAINNYVSMALTLPTINETLGEHKYG